MSSTNERFSDIYRRIVGERALHFNVLSRRTYDTLRAYEDHHANAHADCEVRSEAEQQLAQQLAMRLP